MGRYGRSRSRYSDYAYYPRYTSEPPREAKGGIQARSQSGTIGKTWWSQRFIKSLEAFTETKRLGRGRRYARMGQVMDLQVAPGQVTAKVQGTRARPYDVSIKISPWKDAQWKKIEQALAEDALVAASMLAGELPHEIEALLTTAGADLFARTRQDMKTDCSCPDWANPCKHLAATYYILGERFDEDPFLMLAWRGRSREQLLEHLRNLRGQPQGAADAPEQGASPQGAPLASLMEQYWQSPPVEAELHFRPLRLAQADANLRRLGPLLDPTGGADLGLALAAFYAPICESAERMAYADEDGLDKTITAD